MKHWKPDEELAPAAEPTPKAEWPKGATAGLVLLGLGCIGIATILYRVAGPRDVFGP